MSATVDKTSIAGGFNGARDDVGATPVALSAASKHCPHGLRIGARAGNSVTLYFGFADDVSASDGFPLVPGAIEPLAVDDPAKVYVMADGAESQGVVWHT